MADLAHTWSIHPDITTRPPTIRGTDFVADKNAKCPVNIETREVPDVLGAPYTRRDIVVGDRWDPLAVATLVRRTEPTKPKAVILWLHGYNDYFFHRHVSDELAEQGYGFFALDLRRYGRSLRPGQLVHFVTDLADYYAELDASVGIIRQMHPDVPLILMGHSTGGLVATLYAYDRAPLKWVDGLVLNSPWLGMREDDLLMTLLTNSVHASGAANPTAALPLPRFGVYSQTLHRTLAGEWDYDMEVKNPRTPPVRIGWLSAICRGHARVAAEISLNIPTLVLQSSASGRYKQVCEAAYTSDVVLDTDVMANRAQGLGYKVQLRKVQDAMHDVFLSRPKPRAAATAEVISWLASPAGMDFGGVPSDTSAVAT